MAKQALSFLAEDSFVARLDAICNATESYRELHINQALESYLNLAEARLKVLEEGILGEALENDSTLDE